MLRSYARWLRNRKVTKTLDEVQQAPGAPKLDPNTPDRMFVIEQPGLIGSAFDAIEETIASVLGANKTLEVIKGTNEVDNWAQQAMIRAGRTRGLRFLPARVRRPLQVHLALRQLRESHAPIEAIETLEAKLKEVGGRGNFYNCLFNEALLREVDLTPDVGEGRDYFSKYFQPLMVAFDERAFLNSAGEHASDAQEVLVLHLNNLADRRLRAMRVCNGHPLPDIQSLLQELPKEIPSGYAKSAKQANRKHNKKKAVVSVLAIADPDAAERGQPLELSIEKHLEQVAAKQRFEQWTTNLDEKGVLHCWLWQQQP
jgi:hypothetical protein